MFIDRFLFYFLQWRPVNASNYPVSSFQVFQQLINKRFFGAEVFYRVRNGVSIRVYNNRSIALVFYSCHEDVASAKRVSKEPRSHARIKEGVIISVFIERKKNGLKFLKVSTLIASSWDAPDRFFSFWIHSHLLCANSITGRVFEIAKYTTIMLRFAVRHYHVHGTTIRRRYPIESIRIDDIDRPACRHQISKCLACTFRGDFDWFIHTFGTYADSLIHILMAEDQRESEEDKT